MNAATFHDYCLDLLKRVHKDFGVLDDKDLWIYLRRRIRDLHLEHYIRAANVGQFLNDLLEFVSRCHDELVTPEKYAEYVERLERKEVPIPRVAKSKIVARRRRSPRAAAARSLACLPPWSAGCRKKISAPSAT